MSVLDAIQRAARLEALGITIRSAELREEAKRHREFVESGGNRAMRRAAARAQRRKGRR